MRLHREVDTARLQDAEHGREPFQVAFADHRDGVFVAQAAVAQGVGDAVGAGVELAVGPGAFALFGGDVLWAQPDLFLEELMDPAVGQLAPGAGQPVELVGGLRCGDRAPLVVVRLGPAGERVQGGQQIAGDPPGLAGVERAGAVAEDEFRLLTGRVQAHREHGLGGQVVRARGPARDHECVEEGWGAVGLGAQFRKGRGRTAGHRSGGAGGGVQQGPPRAVGHRHRAGQRLRRRTVGAQVADHDGGVGGQRRQHPCTGGQEHGAGVRGEVVRQPPHRLCGRGRQGRPVFGHGARCAVLAGPPGYGRIAALGEHALPEFPVRHRVGSRVPLCGPAVLPVLPNLHSRYLPSRTSGPDVLQHLCNGR